MRRDQPKGGVASQDAPPGGALHADRVCRLDPALFQTTQTVEDWIVELRRLSAVVLVTAEENYKLEKLEKAGHDGLGKYEAAEITIIPPVTSSPAEFSELRPVYVRPRFPSGPFAISLNGETFELGPFEAEDFHDERDASIVYAPGQDRPLHLRVRAQLGGKMTFQAGSRGHPRPLPKARHHRDASGRRSLGDSTVCRLAASRLGDLAEALDQTHQAASR